MERPSAAIRTTLSPGELIAAGAGAGLISKTVTAPLDRIRILFQVDPRRNFSVHGFGQVGLRIVRRDGFIGLWRGNLAVVLRTMPYAGIQFASFAQYQFYLQGLAKNRRQEHHVTARFCAGALAGATATTLTYPLDFLRTRMAVGGTSLWRGRRYRSLALAAEDVVRNEGVSALYTGIRPTLLGIVPNAGMSFMVFETLKPWMQRELLGLRSERDLPMAWRLAAGGVAGFVAQIATYPLNVVRRRMQVQDHMAYGERGFHSSIANALLNILRSEGLVRGLYKGASLTLVKGPLSTACGFATNDFIKTILARAHGDPERVPPFLWRDSPDVIHDPTSRLKSKNLTPFEHLVSGGTAGALAKTVVAPAERVKILYQTSSDRPFTWQAVVRTGNKIYVNTGFMGLWRGHGATLMQQIPKSALTYVTFDVFRQRIQNLDLVDTVSARFIAGALAGATATTFTYPLDLMRARMAAHWDKSPRYANYFSAFENVIKEEGALNLFKGLRPTLLGIMPYAGLSFTIYETLKARWVLPLEEKRSNVLSTGARLTSGALAGLIAQTATYPLDIVRRRMQVHSEVYQSEWQALEMIWKTEGLIGGLFKGVSMNWVKGPIAVGVSFTINDLVKSWLGSR